MQKLQIDRAQKDIHTETRAQTRANVHINIHTSTHTHSANTQDIYTLSHILQTIEIRLGIDDIIRTIPTYFVVFSDTPNAKFTRNHSEIRMKNIDDTIDP
jgi:hypothetical protein